MSDAQLSEIVATESPGEIFACPTCGARQNPTNECRRCQSDLRMILEIREQCRHVRQRSLALLSARRLKRATALALRCRQLSSDETTASLLATCYLLQGDFAAALQVYARKPSDLLS